MGKDKYIESVKPEMLVAFTLDGVIKSGRVLEVLDSFILLKEYSGKVMEIPKENIIWVKTGARWPKEIFLALRGEDYDE